MSHGIFFEPSNKVGFCGCPDADWSVNYADHNSTYGCTFVLMGAPVRWDSKKQSSVSLSTSKGEYVALS